ncbi:MULTISPECIES: ABC transporter permease [unclassified Actinotalea]|uniref:ABC transporter permease n=1 Tax=unclassified Actinotalea TaxID=2638618 RepID=UPI0015F701DA|nr:MULTISPECIES: iron chelate uptake ABC transporter family permease subunit [unclassified Actinotalea]
MTLAPARPTATPVTARPVRPAATPARGGRRTLFAAVATAVAVLSVVSLFVGVTDVTPAGVLAALTGADDGAAGLSDAGVLLVSRLPRTLAVLLAGSAMAVAGMLMQVLVRNRFVEPSTAGTVESAVLGILVVTIMAPGAPLMGKMGVAAVFALAGTALFLRILRAVPLRSVLVVPLIGLMLGGVISAATTFVAYRLDLLQSLGAWTTGDFSGVLRGRYELLWLTFVLTIVAYLAADRFTVAGMGREVATTLGLGYRGVLNLGLVIVSLVSAVVVVTVGVVPFLGLVVPNVVSRLLGDDVRRTAPWVALLGAGLVLVCDLIGRVVRYPYEVPVGVVVGVVGSVLFLYLLLRRDARVA